jgi:hypothetical protein
MDLLPKQAHQRFEIRRGATPLKSSKSSEGGSLPVNIDKQACACPR